MKKLTDRLKYLNILYAEDDDVVRKNTAKIFDMLCNKVFQADNGRDALHIFKTEQVHIVILDYSMPLLDGAKVAKEIREIDKTVPIFIISSHTEKEKLLSVIGLNLVSYLEKPIDYSTLMESQKKSEVILEENSRITLPLCKGVVYNYLNKSLLIDERVEPLSKNEVAFLELLIQKKGSIVSNEEIENSIFGKLTDLNTLRNMVYRLRKKIGAENNIILTIKDIGYRLEIQ